MKEIVVDGVIYVKVHKKTTYTGVRITHCQGCVGQNDWSMCSKLPACGDFIWIKLAEYRENKLKELGI